MNSLWTDHQVLAWCREREWSATFLLVGFGIVLTNLSSSLRIDAFSTLPGVFGKCFLSRRRKRRTGLWKKGMLDENRRDTVPCGFIEFYLLHTRLARGKWQRNCALRRHETWSCSRSAFIPNNYELFGSRSWGDWNVGSSSCNAKYAHIFLLRRQRRLI